MCYYFCLYLTDCGRVWYDKGEVKPMKNAKYIMDELDKMFPSPKCELEFETPFELLIAVILSAQCTDKRVNMVTKELFKKYNTPQDFVNIPLEEALDAGWEILAECFDPTETGIKSDLVKEFWPNKAKSTDI